MTDQPELCGLGPVPEPELTDAELEDQYIAESGTLDEPTSWGEDVLSTECQCGALGDEDHAADCVPCDCEQCFEEGEVHPRQWDEAGSKPLDQFIEEAAALRPLPEGSLIYGGTGYGNADARQLVVVQPLADRSAMSHKERIIVLDSDVREAMAYARARLNAEAMKYSAQGFTWNLDNISWDHGGRRIITAALRIARNGA